MKVILTCAECAKKYEFETGDIVPEALRCSCGEPVDCAALEKLRRDAELAAKKRLEEEQKLKKQKAYKDFLAKHGYENNGEFKIVNENNVIILYKKIGTLEIDNDAN